MNQPRLHNEKCRKSRASLCAIAKQRRNSSHINKVKNIARCDPHFGANEKKARLTRYHLGRVCLAPNTASSQIGTHASKQTQQWTLLSLVQKNAATIISLHVAYKCISRTCLSKAGCKKSRRRGFVIKYLFCFFVQEKRSLQPPERVNEREWEYGVHSLYYELHCSPRLREREEFAAKSGIASVLCHGKCAYHFY